MKTIEKQHIIAQLKHFNCNENESTIYIHCLGIGPSTIQDIAKDIGRNRTTVDSAVQQLIKKGLLYETRKMKKRYIVAEQPTILLSLLQQKENEIHAIKNNLGYAIDLLSTIKPIDASIPTVKFYEGVEGFKKMLELTLTAQTEVLVYSNVGLFSELVDPDYLEAYFKRRSAKNIHTRLIFPPCDFATRVNNKSAEYKIRVKQAIENADWKASIFSWDDKVALQSFTEGKLTCTIIENKDIAHFYKHLIFDIIWNQSQVIS